MALLEDPTIQRILDEVNKAASDGVLGNAGNYVSQPVEAMASFDSQLPSLENNLLNQNQVPLFYPTSEIFGTDDITSYANNLNLNLMSSIAPIAKPSNFDLYSMGLYTTMPQNFLSPYEGYNRIIKLNSKHQILKNNSLHRALNASSTSKDISLEQHHHQEYPTISPIITSEAPNFGLDACTITQSDPTANDAMDSSEVQLTSVPMSDETTNTMTTSTTNLAADKEDLNSYPLNNHDDNNQQSSNKSIYMHSSAFIFF